MRSIIKQTGFIKFTVCILWIKIDRLGRFQQNCGDPYFGIKIDVLGRIKKILLCELAATSTKYVPNFSSLAQLLKKLCENPDGYLKRKP